MNSVWLKDIRVFPNVRSKSVPPETFLGRKMHIFSSVLPQRSQLQLRLTLQAQKITPSVNGAGEAHKGSRNDGIFPWPLAFWWWNQLAERRVEAALCWQEKGIWNGTCRRQQVQDLNLSDTKIAQSAAYPTVWQRSFSCCCSRPCILGTQVELQL